MRHKLEKRIAELESIAIGDPVRVHLPDGTLRTISGQGKHLQALFAAACDCEHDPVTGMPYPQGSLAEELCWIRDAVGFYQDGGTFQPFELVNAMMRSSSI